MCSQNNSRFEKKKTDTNLKHASFAVGEPSACKALETRHIKGIRPLYLHTLNPRHSSLELTHTHTHYLSMYLLVNVRGLLGGWVVGRLVEWVRAREKLRALGSRLLLRTLILPSSTSPGQTHTHTHTPNQYFSYPHTLTSVDLNWVL